MVDWVARSAEVPTARIGDLTGVFGGVVLGLPVGAPRGEREGGVTDGACARGESKASLKVGSFSPSMHGTGDGLSSSTACRDRGGVSLRTSSSRGKHVISGRLGQTLTSEEVWLAWLLSFQAVSGLT